jgi:membrane complex biogenesis BtpA family protein
MKPCLLSQIFPQDCALVGMVHLLPLPGSPGWEGSMQAVLDRALSDARLLAEGCVDGLMVENYQDIPFYPTRVPPETVAALSVVVREVVREVQIPVGVNVLRNDGVSAIAIACATGAKLVRVNVHTGAMLGDQGVLLGEAYETMRLRANLGTEVALLADVLVKHATPPPGIDLAQAARDAAHRGLADGLIVSGLATGAATDPARLRLLAKEVPGVPLWIGSGVTPENAPELLPLCQGAIVGSTLMHGGVAGHGVDRERLERFMDRALEVRSSR